MFGHGHYYCQSCGHAVYARYGGCRTCQTPLAELIMLDQARDQGICGPDIGFDPFDGEFVFNLGDGIGIEPDGQVDMDLGGFDVPL